MPKTAVRHKKSRDASAKPQSATAAKAKPHRAAKKAAAGKNKTPGTDIDEKFRPTKAASRSNRRPAKAPAGDAASRVPVNQIVEQWQRERPDLDPAPMRLFGALAQAHLLTTPYINRVIARHGLARGTFDVLSALRRAGPPFSLTPTQLAESLMLSGAGMTSRLDRLEALHLVARLPEPNDRRSLKIQLTQKGVKLIDEVIPKIIAAQWQLVSALGTPDTTTLIDLLQRLTETLFKAIDSADAA
jgi:DNA-binding MarR family transcriptional regulator